MKVETCSSSSGLVASGVSYVKIYALKGRKGGGEKGREYFSRAGIFRRKL
ncbi:hypothetical protein YERSI8AC_100035 [Enterobacterales bacterium 8AC]|nr:hypothetical protein YERSI8AC_100035 [Enterobacterales bacterium 8AC]